MPAKHALLVLAGMWWIACAPRGFHNHLVMEPALPGSFITGWCGNLRRAHVIHGRSRKQLLGTYFANRVRPLKQVDVYVLIVGQLRPPRRRWTTRAPTNPMQAACLVMVTHRYKRPLRKQPTQSISCCPAPPSDAAPCVRPPSSQAPPRSRQDAHACGSQTSTPSSSPITPPRLPHVRAGRHGESNEKLSRASRQ